MAQCGLWIVKKEGITNGLICVGHNFFMSQFSDMYIPTPVETFVRGFVGSTAGILCSLNGLVPDNSINQYNKIEVGHDAHVLSSKDNLPSDMERRYRY